MMENIVAHSVAEVIEERRAIRSFKEEPSFKRIN